MRIALSWDAILNTLPPGTGPLPADFLGTSPINPLVLAVCRSGSISTFDDHADAFFTTTGRYRRRRASQHNASPPSVPPTPPPAQDGEGSPSPPRQNRGPHQDRSTVGRSTTQAPSFKPSFVAIMASFGAATLSRAHPLLSGLLSLIGNAERTGTLRTVPSILYCQGVTGLRLRLIRTALMEHARTPHTLSSLILLPLVWSAWVFVPPLTRSC